MTAKNMGIISLVCGIVGLVGGFLMSIPVIQFLVPLCPIAGIVFGALALKNIKATGNADGKGLAVAGFVLGIIAVALDVLMLICIGLCAGAACAAVGSNAFGAFML